MHVFMVSPDFGSVYLLRSNTLGLSSLPHLQIWSIVYPFLEMLLWFWTSHPANILISQLGLYCGFVQEEFEEYAEKAKTLPENTTNENKLILYGLYKQATVGNVNTSRPGIFNLRERAKWDAWKAVEGNIYPFSPVISPKIWATQI
ncbi:Acyl-CoA-binding protein [Vitis vinifera]|uniref:Acyl-CoA-binding protein n=1 Tax=Vitis vinifera TaxID=29760 RepID=A0A438IAI9_VITVI|nr:Acyl-CoA-binding protein [Vitis vinifera]